MLSVSLLQAPAIRLRAAGVVQPQFEASVIQAGSPHSRFFRPGSTPARAFNGSLVVALLLSFGLLAGCSGGGAGGGDAEGDTGAGTQFEDTSDVVDDRYVGGDTGSDGTDSIVHGYIPPPPAVEDTSLY